MHDRDAEVIKVLIQTMTGANVQCEDDTGKTALEVANDAKVMRCPFSLQYGGMIALIHPALRRIVYGGAGAVAAGPAVSQSQYPPPSRRRLVGCIGGVGRCSWRARGRSRGLML